MLFMQDNQFVGAIGGSGGMDIIPAVVQVFLNYFILGMKPLAAVKSPRVYHKVPNSFQFIEIDFYRKSSNGCLILWFFLCS